MTQNFILFILSFMTIKRIRHLELLNQIKHLTNQDKHFSQLFSSILVLKNALVGATLFILFILSMTGPLRADYSPKQPSINLDDVESGQLLMRSGNELSSSILLSTDVKISVAGSSSRTIISQRFINTGETWAEGVYVFPIGENSAVDTMKLRIGERDRKTSCRERV